VVRALAAVFLVALVTAATAVANATGRAVRLEFRVPRVTAGRYVLGIWCKPCNEHWTSALPNWQPAPLGILRVL
jgi:hypothetical protein